METTIKKLFDSKNRKFEIPPYQRAYAWDEEQINQFIEDISNAQHHYYLGHYLFETKPGEENTLLVIDGQQRLTTCIIFFSVAIKELKLRKEKGDTITIDIDDIRDYYLRDLRKEVQKFKTVRDDNNFFIEEIIDSNQNHTQEIDTFSKTRIRVAKKIFTDKLKDTETLALEKWCMLIENATITEYVVKDKTQATQVFAFQNDRGKKLSNLEIIKAFFMLQVYLNSLPGRLDEHITYLEEELSKIYKQLVRINLGEDEVLNYYWRAVSGDGYYSAEVVTGIKDAIFKENDKMKWIREFISGLSQAFATVEKIEKSNDPYTRDLRYLNNMALSYPFIIKAYKLKAVDNSIYRLIRLMENITFRYLLRGGRAEIEARLNDHLIGFTDAAQLGQIIKNIIWLIQNNGYWSYWNDTSMVAYLSGYFYKNRVDNYVLWKYELYIAGKNHPLPHAVSFNELIKGESIEHIAPQTPTNGNPVTHGYGAYENKENPEVGIVSGNWLNSIGNLMLISRPHNSSIGNKPFEEKLASYGLANLLNQQKEIINFVSNREHPVWDSVAIVKRQKAIINAASHIWDLAGIGI